MNRPLILISTSTISSPQLANLTGDTKLLYTDQATGHAVVQAGGLPVYVPALNILSKKDLRQYIRLADGLLLTGADTVVSPELYDTTQNCTAGRVDLARDRIDVELVRLAYSSGLPLFGICKGMQLINVALGGSLYQDVDKEKTSDIVHNVKNADRTAPSHQLLLMGDSLLKSVFDADLIETSGGHQQAIRTVAPQLRAIATSQDGIVEAYEAINNMFVLGVQFHAELRLFDPPFLALFETFVEMCRQMTS